MIMKNPTAALSGNAPPAPPKKSNGEFKISYSPLFLVKHTQVDGQTVRPTSG